MDRRHPARLIRHAAQRTCRRSMRTATAALGTTMSRPSSLAGSHRVSLPISSQGAAKDCALSLTWSGRAAENAGLLKRQHRSRSQRRFPEDALVANVGCRRNVVIAGRFGEGPVTEPTAAAHPPADKSDGVGHQRRSRDRESRRRTWRNKLLGQALNLRYGSQMYRSACGSDLHADMMWSSSPVAVRVDHRDLDAVDEAGTREVQSRTSVPWRPPTA